MLPVASASGGSASFAKLPQTPGQARSYTAYVESSSVPSGYQISGNGSHGLSWQSASNPTPLGNGWYELCTVSLPANDAASKLTFSYLGSGVTNVCLVQQTYDVMGDMLSLTDPDGNTTSWTYDGLGREKA